MYKRVAETFDNLADSWPSNHPDIAKAADAIGSSYPNHRPYINLVDIMLDQMESSSDQRIVNLSRRPGVRHGLGVVTRFYCHQFQSAVANSVPLEAAGIKLHQQAVTTSSPLSVLANKPNRVMMEHEDALGLAKDRYCYKDGRYDTLVDWRGTRIEHPGQRLEAALEGRYRYAMDNPEEFIERNGQHFNSDGKCPVERANQLTSISRSVLDICLKDASLAKRTYQLGITRC